MFDVPLIQAGFYKIRVRLDPIGETNSLSIVVKSQFNPTSYSGSTEGGFISILGTGLPNSWPAKLFTLSLKKNGLMIDPVIIETSENRLQL